MALDPNDQLLFGPHPASGRALTSGRVMIPTVYREDYLLPLKALSQNRGPAAYVRSMTRAQRWSAAFDYDQDVHKVREDLAACNAFREDLRNFKLIFPECRAE